MEVEIIDKNPAPTREMQDFVRSLYTENSPSFTPIEKAERVILLRKKGNLVAMAACYLNEALPETLILGNFECMEDSKISNELFNKVKETGKALGCQKIIGPMNGSTWYAYRYSISLKNPFFLEANHQPYYPEMWENGGFKPLTYYQTNIETFKPDKPLADAENYFRETGFTVRPLNKSNLENEIKLLYAFTSEVFSNNLFFSTISEADFRLLYLPLLQLADERFVQMAFDGHKLIGLFFSIENRFNPSQIIVKTIARNPEYKYRGLIENMIALFYSSAIKAGYKEMLNAYMHMDNRSKKISENYGGNCFRSHVLYQCPI